MYVPSHRLPWWRLLFKVRGSVLPKIWRRIAFVTAVSAAVTLVREELQLFSFSLTPLPFTLIGLPLGIFLGFRNGAAYDRFWEGRKLWGALVNTSRTFTRQVTTLVRGEGDDGAACAAWQRSMILRTIGFVHALRLHLRGKSEDAWRRFIPEEELGAYTHEKNLPIAILQRQGENLADAWRRGWIHAQHVPSLDASLTSFCDIQGGCERIKSTPIPFSYTILIHRIVAIYCFLLPFGAVETIHWMTPVVVAFISYAFFGLDQIGDEIEDPFGADLNDLPLAAISRTIEINLKQRLGESELPEAPSPRDGVLM